MLLESLWLELKLNTFFSPGNLRDTEAQSEEKAKKKKKERKKERRKKKMKKHFLSKIFFADREEGEVLQTRLQLVV